MKVLQAVLAFAVFFWAAGAWAQNAAMTTQVSTGIVENVREVQLTQSNTGRGAAVGTAVGAVRSSNNRTRSVVTGAVVGGVLGKATSRRAPGREYVVRTGPNTVITVVSPQTEIHKGDCVTVQQSGREANIRRVEQNQCAGVAK